MGFTVHESSREEMIYLWEASFGDTPDEISLFLDSADYRFLGLSENGALVSQLFLLPGRLPGGESVFYLYAACTVPECRGWGYMSRLLEAAKEFARRSGAEYIFLLPSDEGLYGFYEKSGYKPLCRQKRVTLKSEDILGVTVQEDYGRIIYDEKFYDYADKMYSSCGYKTFSNSNAGVIYETEGTDFTVKEWRGENFAGAVKVLAGMENCERVIIDLPCEAEVNAACEISEMNHGMVLPLGGSECETNFFLNYVLD